MSTLTQDHSFRRLLGEKEVSEIIHISVPTLRRWRHEKKGPKFIKLGSSVRYDQDEIRRYLESSSQETGTR